MPRSSDNRVPTPNIPTYPFLIFGAPVLIGLVIHFMWGVDFLPPAAALISGLILLTAGAALGMWSVWTMLSQGEHPEPSRPTEKLLINGPFRFSRNPSYLALLISAIGLGLGLSSIPILISVPAGFALLALWVVPAEERYLAALFGDEYREYQRRVRRWV
jgi:protein-S-isoprenylcysteine O-methyltransferase Ste14